MKTLPHDVSRCSSIIMYSAHEGDKMPEHDICPHRETCQRFLSLTLWDRNAGVPDYKGISVTMAVEDCQDKIEIDNPL